MGVLLDIKGQVLYRELLDFLIGPQSAEGGGVRVVGHLVEPGDGALLLGSAELLEVPRGLVGILGVLPVQGGAADLAEQLVRAV